MRLREEGFVFDDEDIVYVGNQVSSVLLTADNLRNGITYLLASEV